MTIEEQVEQELDDDLEQEIAQDVVIENEGDAEIVDPELDDEDEVIVTIAGESPPQEQGEDDFEGRPAPQWVKDLRKKNRELERELKQVKTVPVEQEQAKQTIVLGEKPTLEKFDYDAEEYEIALDTWYTRKREADEQDKIAKSEQEKQAEQWQGVLNSYNDKKANLKVRDFDDAEFEITSNLSQQQQAIILDGADNPALVVYALGKNKSRLEELSKITNPVKFAYAVAKLETQMKTTTRKATVDPEKKVKGNGNLSGTIDSTLERLRKEAETTGDYSKVVQHKRKMRNK